MSTSGGKLTHRVIYCTSEDNGYPSRELNNSNADNKGWMSARFPEYPQELGFEIISNYKHKDVHISQIQILSHQSKIATKIEIFIGKMIYTYTYIYNI